MPRDLISRLEVLNKYIMFISAVIEEEGYKGGGGLACRNHVIYPEITGEYCEFHDPEGLVELDACFEHISLRDDTTSSEGLFTKSLEVDGIETQSSG